ncbi:MAG: ATP-binding cassette domain-containing protein [Lachnospiraceae bacterium]|nr:ATP-binding cassette domain-containing protein [Lachnospiraceae bacterium]
MIEIRHLYKRFDEKQLFSDLNLVIEDGEFVVFWGESGCGKTTLLNMIGSLEKIDQGEILVNHKDIFQRKNQREYLRNEVGFLFQNFALIEAKTVRENLNMVKKQTRSEYTVEQALEGVGLSDVVDKQVFKLSGGEQQRVALARLMIKKCSIILADEPTGSLDPGNADKVMELLQAFHKMGRTVILVTHVEKYKRLGFRTIEIA